MKKNLIWAIAALLCLNSCVKGIDRPDEPVNIITDKDIQANAEKVFGVSFDPNHDWCTTVSGAVTIHADESVRKVQVLVNTCEIDSPETPYYVTRNVMKVLNEAETNGLSTIKLNYDAPKDNLGLFVAFITNHGCVIKKVEGNTASISMKNSLG